MSVREIKFYFVFIFFSSSFDIRSFDRRNSSDQEQKFIYSTRVTREYQKTRDFVENSSKKFGKS